MDDQQLSRWRLTRSLVLWTVGVVALLTVAVLIGYRYDITLWDWLKLLVVPAVITGGGLWYNAQQRQRDQQIANTRAQNEALQTYLDQMSGLLIPPSKDLPSLYKARPNDSLSSVARARTLTVLPRLDKDRKARVVQFLYEAGLIYGKSKVLALHQADLVRANLSRADLFRADLSGAYLFWANLIGTNLSRANLGGADLSWANLKEANLGGAYLGGADLSGANLGGANLIGADLIGTNLGGANLSRADLFRANLSRADLFRADLSGANLSGANLSGAEGIGSEELEQQAASLEDATMPNGQTYEDWLKDKRAARRIGRTGNPS